MKLSLNQKFALLQLPLCLVGTVVCWIAWQTGNNLKSNEDIQKINGLALKSGRYVAEMGGALKGYMLDPSNDGEAKRKKEADENNSKAIDEMKALTQDVELLALIKELGELDDKQLNPAEDHVVELVGKRDFEGAVAYFKSDYLPLRSKYDELSQKLSDISEARAAAAAKEFKSRVHQGIWNIISFLAIGITATSILIIWTLMGVTKSLSSLKDKLSETSKKVREVSNSVSDVSQALAGSSNQAAAAIQESVSSMTEMSAMLKQTNRNIETTATLSTEVLEQSQHGIKVMEEMSVSMQAISSSSSRLAEISKVIENISSKTNVINDVVFKTQLLAVNASIEAARAGHHGKGFAVVANEVASLAALSGKASSEIKELLQSSSARVIEIIESTSKSVHQGESICAKSFQTFSTIVGSISKVSDRVDQISSASREQEAGVTQISAALSQINEATSSTNEIAHKNAGLGQGLSKHAANLQQIDRNMTLIVFGNADKSTASFKFFGRTSEIDNILDFKDPNGSMSNQSIQQAIDQPFQSENELVHGAAGYESEAEDDQIRKSA